ncbi:hypothetical protein HRI_002349100 [Hibiscus trionum]|uniref:Reverse transcriptase domain-containing protein n=1 Tax=Hibiscus trionum TaxID=183268 RepID=A0A9W7I276_HIBTR|nr:hypothetical protein HRI_002349100 [Hibiscus trionum]
MVRVIFWNVQGAAGSDFFRCFKLMVHVQKPDIVALFEPRISGVKADYFIRRTGFDNSYRVEATGFSGGIWVLWRSSVKIDVVAISSQFVHGWCYDIVRKRSCFLTFVYASPNSSKRSMLWDQLQALAPAQEVAWVLGGDFNAIASPTEREGGSSNRLGVCSKFKDFLFDSGLVDMGFQGPLFTWERGDLKQRLDRCLCNEALFQVYTVSEVLHLPKLESDHNPIMLHVGDGDVEKATRPFRYVKAWNDHPDFHRLVSEVWSGDKSIFDTVLDFQNRGKVWNRDVFGHIGRRKTLLIARIKGVELARSRRDSEFLRGLERDLKMELTQVLKEEESLWQQKSRVTWLSQGDRNTRFFHGSAIQRRRRNTISALKVDAERWCYEHQALKTHAMEYFRNLFSAGIHDCTQQLLSGKFHTFSEGELRSLSADVTMEEVRKVVFEMDPNKSPGIDGIHADFYQKKWDVVGESVFNLVNDFFDGAPFDSRLNQTLVVLIPKVESPELISQFRPISLCTVLYKVIAKTLVNRLKKFLPKWVSANQVSFVPGRNITDNIILAQEIIHSMSIKSGKEGFMAIKVDLEKAYDRLEWHFIEDTLREVGLPDKLTELIMMCVRTVSTQILWNGDVTESFRPSRGIRQGDLLSPYLFVLCMERLAHRIDAEVEAGAWKPIRLAKSGTGISHLFFADDLVLFAEANAKQMSTIHTVMEQFCACSGHRVSVAKTQIYFSKNVSHDIRVSIGQSLGFEVVEDLGKYLGVPLLHKRVSKATYAYLLEKMEKRLSGWVAKSLSLAGRITLAKAVLQAIPTYVMQATFLPKGICREMERIVRRFVWGGSDIKRSIALVNWESMRTPIMNGGMRFKDLEVQNNAFIMKVGFEVLTEPTKLWVRVIREKYGWNEEVPLSIDRKRCSRLWKGLSKVWEAIRGSIIWNVRDGVSTDFWYDTWVDEEGPLCERYLSLSPPCPSPVSAMVTADGGWDWGRFEHLIPPEVVDKIYAIPPPRAWFGPDCPSYRWEIDKTFTVRSAYRFLAGSWTETAQEKWRVLWDLNLPQRVLIFLWLVLRGGLLTNVERVRRQLASEGGCGICRQGEEDIDHVLRRCPAACRLWRGLIPNGYRGVFDSMGLEVWLLHNLRNDSTIPKATAKWETMFAVGCWLLWKRRCSLLFDEEYIGAEDIAAQCRQLAAEFELSPSPTGVTRRARGLLVRWQCPPEGWVKLNADGSVYGQHKEAAIGGVVRDSLGRWLFGFARRIGVCSVLMAELWAAYEALMHAWRMGFKKVVLESDNLEVTRILSNESMALRGDVVVDLIFGLLCRDWEVRVQHIGREGNMVADLLACQFGRQQRGIGWLVEPPVEVQGLLELDRIG